jgi:hypothetical protein
MCIDMADLLNELRRYMRRDDSNIRLRTTSRWVLYHGTSTRRLKQILGEKRLRVSAAGDRKVALTPEYSVAEYCACTAVVGDRHDHPDEDSDPVVVTLDGEGLLDLRYELEGHSDPFWGDGECDWENETACWSDIDLNGRDDLVIGIEPVRQDRWDVYNSFEGREERSRAFKPIGPRLADHELAIMKDTVSRLADEQITSAQADDIATALNLLRLTLRSAVAGE